MTEDAIARRPRAGAIVLLVMDLILVAAAFHVILFVTPAFAAMFQDFGAQLPALTVFVLHLSQAMRASFGIGCIACGGMVVALIVGVFVVLYKGDNGRALSVWLWTILLVNVVLLGFMVTALFSPMLTMTEALSG